MGQARAFMVGVPALRRCSGGRSSARAALRAASTGSMPAKGGCSSNSWYAIMLKLYTSTCARSRVFQDWIQFLSFRVCRGMVTIMVMLGANCYRMTAPIHTQAPQLAHASLSSASWAQHWTQSAQPS